MNPPTASANLPASPTRTRCDLLNVLKVRLRRSRSVPRRLGGRGRSVSGAPAECQHRSRQHVRAAVANGLVPSLAMARRRDAQCGRRLAPSRAIDALSFDRSRRVGHLPGSQHASPALLARALLGSEKPDQIDRLAILRSTLRCEVLRPRVFRAEKAGSNRSLTRIGKNKLEVPCEF